ncbi:hypothetical protein [Streptomyces sp. NPDC057302]|uniref:hypothetical protein n=1 Tax=Streptomyces sp. NPDC057302 TaxID=3346094 RepID=UPI00362B2E88
MIDRDGQEQAVALPVMRIAPPHKVLPARHVKMPIDLKVGRLGTYRLGWMELSDEDTAREFAHRLQGFMQRAATHTLLLRMLRDALRHATKAGQQ